MVKNINASQIFQHPIRRTASQAAPHTPTVAVPFGDSADNDSVEISAQARRAQADRENFIFWQNEMATQRQQARETLEAKAEASNKMLTAFEIAARIMRGDIVPPSDIEFLSAQSPGLLMMAMSSRSIDNENPEEHDAIAPREQRRRATPVLAVPRGGE